MTIYNHEQFLKDSIQSIQSQTLKNWELIAIDNGSTDNSRKILNSFKDRCIIVKYKLVEVINGEIFLKEPNL